MMAHKNPIISVVMPIYNAELYLKEAVESILAQTFTNFELLALDDGSHDSSLDILRIFAQRDTRVQIVTHPNAGIVPTLNRGIAMARGTYIARMDADDIAQPDRLAVQIQMMQDDPTLVALGTQFLLIDPQSRPLCRMKMPLDHQRIDAKHVEGVTQICHPTALIHTAALKRIGGYLDDYPYAEDIDLFLRLAEVGRLANSNYVGLHYRQHLSSIGYTKRLTQLLSCWSAAKAAAERRKLDFHLPKPDMPTEQAKVNVSDVLKRWGWWALGGGEVKTARYYARQLLYRKPISLASLRLMYCALRGH